MLTMILFGSLIVLAIGFIAKFVLDKKGSELRITVTEYAIASAVMLAIVIPLTSWIGFKLAFNNAVTYNEYWNGIETQAEWVKIPCGRDSGAQHTYSCDPYRVRVSYECGG